MFQKRIVEKYLSQISPEVLSAAYEKFQKIFGNEAKQTNIRNSKEEQYQEGFIRDLFVSVLGYTIKPEQNYNIFTEAKNDVRNKSNSKKADAAICEENNENNIKAVIELKGTNTVDLDHVAFQAFSYKNFHEGCNYIILSNFQRLRFYVGTQSDYLEFNLFDLSFDDFAVLYLILQIDQIKNDIPLKLKNETLSEEKQITNDFYKDYSSFKRSLFEDLIEKNPDLDKLLLFKKTQKLLDRILFILFCEDRGLLPANSVLGIINDWNMLKKMGYPQPLYNLFKTFFERINTGFVNSDDHSRDIFAYNGGLFKTDDVLDNIKVGDDILLFTHKLSDYDFDSQISVDILGRIFENSLTEIEEVQKAIEDEKHGVVTSQSNIGKRKKDGVFYTPEYITKYIVENTIGKLCRDKKEELKIFDSDFTYDNNYSKKQKNDLDSRLEAYRNWLLGLKILDPACGSGAFLNSALHELKKEHTYIDHLWEIIHPAEFNLSQIDNVILENNLYGVDINEDSIEITKLSLWLHTAQKNRKLTTLNDKIKCGNSLIDDKEVAGDKAFYWKKEFPEVFEQGGFDVVIGNPPYVRVQQLDLKTVVELKKKYKTALKRIDISLCFIEKSRDLLKENGITTFITSNQFLTTEYGQAMRQFLLNDYFLIKTVDFGDLPIFADAMTYVSIFVLSKKQQDSFEYYHVSDIEKAKNYDFGKPQIIELSSLNDSNWNLQKFGLQELFVKMKHNSIALGKIGNAGTGLITGLDDVLMFSKSELEKYDFESEVLLPILRAENCNKYYCSEPEKYVIYPYKYENGKTTILKETELAERYPKTYQYLLDNKERLSLRKDSRKTLANRDDWYTLTRFGQKNIFDQQKIVSPGEVKNHKFSIDSSKAGFSCARVFGITISDNSFDIRYVLCILNSHLMQSFLQSISSPKAGGYYSYSSNILNRTPIKVISPEEQKSFIALADKMLSLNAEVQKKISRFIGRIKERFGIVKVTTVLESFYTLDFKAFVKELAKQKVKLSLREEDEWEEYFTEYKNEITALNAQIASTDKEIDAVVYKLYGLTEDEIKIVEEK